MLSIKVNLSVHCRCFKKKNKTTESIDLEQKSFIPTSHLIM